jgi:outer membrane lipoprotein-sorting protein
VNMKIPDKKGPKKLRSTRISHRELSGARIRYVSIIAIIGILSSGPRMAYCQKLTAGAIIDRVNEIMNRPTVVATTRMIITTTSGQKREFVFESYSKDKGDKSLIRYSSPKRVKGQAILMLNNADDIWVYFPRTNRVRKLATHAKKQKMEGSDFSYEDMGSGDAWIEDFVSRLLDDEKINDISCYKLELTIKENAESAYSRMIMWINKENFVPLQIDYYDEDDPTLHLKRLTLSDIRMIEDVPTPMKVVMVDIQDNTHTIMEYESITYKEDLPDDIFSERGMKG